jgi:hypothetical protein
MIMLFDNGQYPMVVLFDNGQYPLVKILIMDSIL